jgi:rhamnosyltransferase
MANHSETARKVSVVIPVLNPAAYLPSLLQALNEQKPEPPSEVVLVDSGSTDNTREIAAAHPLVRVVEVEKFSHGRARNVGVQAATGDIVVLMTQDAKPSGPEWMEALIAPLGKDRVVATCSRQIPHPSASPMETFYLQKNFPDGTPVRREKRPGHEVELSDIFFSNVSSAILRETLLQFPFDEDLIMGEDQQFTKDVLNAGYATLYVPASVVIHSHSFTLRETFKRYFDSIYAITTLFPNHHLKGSANIGIAYVLEELRYLARHAPLWLFYYPFYVLAKTSATLLAHRADRLPIYVLRRVSMHSYHWQG